MYENKEQGMWVNAFNPSIPEQRQVYFCEFQASLLYKASFRTAMAITQRNKTLSQNRKKENNTVQTNKNREVGSELTSYQI